MSAGASNARTSYRADRARYPAAAWLYERSLWALAVYRLQQGIDERTGGIETIGPPWGALARGAGAMLAVAAQIATGIEIPRHTRIGPGLRIHHAGPIVVNPEVVIGRDCTLRHGVTIGNLTPGGPVPVIGDRVEFGVYAQVLGGVKIGEDARIGAMTLVLEDVPAGATAVGIPARILPPRERRSDG
jgi:serine O-acetyltransferase